MRYLLFFLLVFAGCQEEECIIPALISVENELEEYLVKSCTNYDVFYNTKTRTYIKKEK